MTALFVVAGCASSGRTTERATVFNSDHVPTCDFEVIGEVTTVVSVRGDRAVAEERLRYSLARAAERRGGNGVLGMVVVPPERVLVVRTATRRSSDSDLPAVEWSARGQVIRFTDPACHQ